MTEKEFDKKVVETLELIYATILAVQNDEFPVKSHITVTENIRNMKEHLAKSKAFKPPTIEQVEKWGRDHGYEVDGKNFCEFYENKEWKIGKVKMKKWELALSRACREGWCLAAGTSKAISSHKCKFCRTRPADGKSEDNSGQPYHWCRVCQPKKWAASRTV